jgi:hypothetical protein
MTGLRYMLNAGRVTALLATFHNNPISSTLRS